MKNKRIFKLFDGVPYRRKLSFLVSGILPTRAIPVSLSLWEIKRAIHELKKAENILVAEIVKESEQITKR